jgi:hypothetical protein
MAEWKRFCCAIDFSEPSRLAMRAAAELTRRLDGQLELLHVHPLPPPAVAIEALPPRPDVLETVIRELRDATAPCPVLVIRRREKAPSTAGSAEAPEER